MTITSIDLVKFCETALAEKWGYVWSSQGEHYTKELAKAWGKAERAGKSNYYYTTSCKKWFDHFVADCSGLIVAAFREKGSYSDRNSSTFKSQFVESGDIDTIPEIPGLAVWRNGHIGVYVGNGRVIEAAGYRWGVVKTPVDAPMGYQYYKRTSKKWTHWGRFKDVEYSESIPDIIYTAHVQNVGDQEYCSNGEIAGTTGQSLRLEALTIDIPDMPGALEYRGHIQNLGWMDTVEAEAVAGTKGESLRLEAITINLKDEAAEKYDIYYRVHVQDIGWMDWVCNGAVSGTTGQSLRMEAIRIVLVEKGGDVPDGE